MSDIAAPSPVRIYRLTDISNKKKLFERLAQILSVASEELSFEKVLDSLLSRERMGSTCIGDGVAIPHCKLSVEHPIGAILQLDEAIACNNKEEQVSVIFGLIIPEDQCQAHMSLLSDIATLCRTDNWLNQIKRSQTDDQLRQLLEETGLNLEPYQDEATHS